MDPITHESVALYALGALDEAERGLFEAHLAGCDRCRADLDGLRAAASALALAVAPAEPRPSLRARILAVIERSA